MTTMPLNIMDLHLVNVQMSQLSDNDDPPTDLLLPSLADLCLAATVERYVDGNLPCNPDDLPPHPPFDEQAVSKLLKNIFDKVGSFPLVQLRDRVPKMNGIPPPFPVMMESSCYSLPRLVQLMKARDIAYQYESESQSIISSTSSSWSASVNSSRECGHTCMTVTLAAMRQGSLWNPLVELLCRCAVCENMLFRSSIGFNKNDINLGTMIYGDWVPTKGDDILHVEPIWLDLSASIHELCPNEKKRPTYPGEREQEESYLQPNEAKTSPIVIRLDIADDPNNGDDVFLTIEPEASNKSTLTVPGFDRHISCLIEQDYTSHPDFRGDFKLDYDPTKLLVKSKESVGVIGMSTAASDHDVPHKKKSSAWKRRCRSLQNIFSTTKKI